MRSSIPARGSSTEDRSSRRLNIFSASDLERWEIPPLRWVIPGLLPEGLTILAGAPKLGKSRLVLDLALRVTLGDVALEKFPTEQGEVLYLALEDGKRRLKNRIQEMLQGSPFPDGLHFSTTSSKLNEGFLAELDDWLSEHSDTRLVIIDTLARIRSKSRTNNVYLEDTEICGSLQDLAERHHVAILFVHHTRKMKDDDIVDEVSGSHGLTGVADTLWILQRSRGQQRAKVFMTGRDVEDYTIELESGPGGTWRYIGEGEPQILLSIFLQQVLDAVRKEPEPISEHDLSLKMGIDPKTRRLKYPLMKLVEYGLVYKPARGLYAAIPPGQSNAGRTSDEWDSETQANSADAHADEGADSIGPWYPADESDGDSESADSSDSDQGKDEGEDDPGWWSPAA